MIEIKIDNDSNPPSAAFFREGQYKCLIDYNHLRRCLRNDDTNIRDLVIGSLLSVLEDNFTNKLDKQELQTLNDFLDKVKNSE